MRDADETGPWDAALQQLREWDPAWAEALVTLVKTDRARAVEVRKINGNGLVDAPAGIVEILRAARLRHPCQGDLGRDRKGPEFRQDDFDDSDVRAHHREL